MSRLQVSHSPIVWSLGLIVWGGGGGEGPAKLRRVPRPFVVGGVVLCGGGGGGGRASRTTAGDPDLCCLSVWLIGNLEKKCTAILLFLLRC